MKISPQQYQHYWDKGWVVVEGVFAPALVEKVAQRALELVQQDTTSNINRFDSSPDGKELMPRKLMRPFANDRNFGAVLFASELPALLEQLTGVPPLFFTDQIFFKPPRHGTAKPYHQDNAYFLMQPDDHVITAWIAMDDVDEENGCLRYIDGSHKGPLLPCQAVPGREFDLTPDPALIDHSKESPARVKKGGVVFHHANTLHYSGPNTSHRWRRGYATHWVAADVTTTNSDLMKMAYFKMPEMFEGIESRPMRGSRP